MPRPTMSDIAVSIHGIINFTANLYRTTEPKNKGESFKLICPTCTDPTKPSQKYLCPSCTGQFSSGECDKAREVGKVLHRVTQEEIDAVKEVTLPEKQLTLQAYPADEVLAAIRPDGVSYRLQPEKFKDVAAMALALVESLPDTVFLGEMNSGRGGEKVFMLTVWHGALVVQEMARPEEVIEFEPDAGSYDQRLIDPARQFVNLQTTSFTAENFASRRKARLAELDVAKVDGTPVPVATKAPEVSATDNLLAMLEAQIAANKAS